MINDVGDLLKSFLCQLQETDIALRSLNEKIEPTINIDYLDDEFATVQYEDEIVHVMC